MVMLHLLPSRKNSTNKTTKFISAIDIKMGMHKSTALDYWHITLINIDFYLHCFNENRQK